MKQKILIGVVRSNIIHPPVLWTQIQCVNCSRGVLMQRNRHFSLKFTGRFLPCLDNSHLSCFQIIVPSQLVNSLSLQRTIFCCNPPTNLNNSVILYVWLKVGNGPRTVQVCVHMCVCVSVCVHEKEGEREHKSTPKPPQTPILLMVSFGTICPLRQHSSSTGSTVTVGFGVKDRHVV